MSNQFCRFLSNGYSFSSLNNSLIVKPCCWYQGGTILDENFEKNKHNQSQINNWTSGCSVCKAQETAGQKSFRQSSFEILPEVENNIPLAIDINLDRSCNAACVICGPESSTFWSKQLDDKKTIQIQNEKSPANYIDYITNNFDLTKVKRIKFFGGEPLFTDTHLKVLQKIPRPEQCEVWYTTNGSILPAQDVLDTWKQFKLVFFEASIDGIESRFNYLRWPLQWNKVSKNLLELREQGPANLLFRINHTLNPFNIFYYNELDSWIHNNLSSNRLGDSTEINIHPCWGNWDLAKTPASLRDEISKKYSNSIVSKILSGTAVLDYSSIINFTKNYDIKRKITWTETFPEVIKYFP
jgi:hypothetical protein